MDFADSKCVDFHDHVYALLGFHRSTSVQIVPDYSKSELQLFLEVTTHLRRAYHGTVDPSPRARYRKAAELSQRNLKLTSDLPEVREVGEDLQEMNNNHPFWLP